MQSGTLVVIFSEHSFMKEQNPNQKLLAVSAINTVITACLWQTMKSDQSASLGYFIMLIILWVMSAIAAGILISTNKIKLKNWNLLVFLFCTPIPFLFFLKATSKENEIGTTENNKNNHRIKEVQYKNRKEYFTSVELTTDKTPFPLTESYRLDSIVYNDGSKTKYFKK